MRFYVFATEAEAQAAIDKIDGRARMIYAAQGYQVAEDGSIIGHRASDGEPMPDAQRTETFAEPRQRLDGKWVVPHTENCPSPNFVINAQGVTISQFVGQDITAPVEEQSADWFYKPEGY